MPLLLFVVASISGTQFCSVPLHWQGTVYQHDCVPTSNCNRHSVIFNIWLFIINMLFWVDIFHNVGMLLISVQKKEVFKFFFIKTLSAHNNIVNVNKYNKLKLIFSSFYSVVQEMSFT